MEIRQLKYFIAVAEEANFTRAAQRVHISQPGISAQIRQLENDLGATLFDRSGRGAGLTAVGEVALAHAREVVAAAQSLRRSVDEMNGLVRGKLVVGMVTACTVTPLFDALSAFHRAHPGVEVSLIEDDSDRLVGHVREGRADMALIGAAGGPPAGLDGWPIITEPVVAAVPAGHPLAERGRIPLAELVGHPIICLPQGTGVRAAFDRSAAALGLTPAVALQASAPGAVAALALRGLGVAVLSESMAARYEGLRTVPIADAGVPAVLALITATTGSPALRELLAYCRRFFGEPQPAGAAPLGGLAAG
ncbi:LysR family transcriptional regulator [Streptacidiphilus sp. ASG 303]|uniref:LysR family transcriptional regulator n=1 Tax=Streptacidiphilus sp. ASG 303 TaxID=2896847 RepID=UPI001E60D26D|nr:LysR family transcriptional regulator [Streptacidiphilus sp. ASG 303]MCD0483363.1 LysR family transcriptional regulator [Streptacidiphilus sp. ASG 303]